MEKSGVGNLYLDIIGKTGVVRVDPAALPLEVWQGNVRPTGEGAIEVDSWHHQEEL